MIAESVKEGLEQIKKHGLTGEVYGIESRNISYAVEKDEISDTSEYEELGLGIRVKVGKKVGFAYGVPGLEEKAVRKAKELAKFQDELNIKFPKTERIPGVKTFDDDVINTMDNDEGLELTLDMLSGVKKGVTANEGGIVLFTDNKVLGSTSGTFLEDSGTAVVCSVAASIKTEETALTAYESECSRKLDIEFADVGYNASDKVESMRDKNKVSSGKYNVVLSPTALSQIMCFSLLPSFSGENVRKGRSVYQEKLGLKVADEHLNLKDDPTCDWGVGSGKFDDEGVASTPLPLIEKGTLRNFMYNLKEGVKSDTESTGNGIRINFKTPPMIGERNVILEGKNTAVGTLLKEADIYIDDVMGAHTSNAVSGDFSVVIYPGWRLKNGEKNGRLDGVLISGNIHECLEELELADDSRSTYLDLGGKKYVMKSPSVLLQDISIASG